ncbi:MAG TPA: TMEM143 family protein [Pirellulales bacterium]
MEPSKPANESIENGAAARHLEHFIPWRKAELIDRLCTQPGLAPAEQDGFRRLCILLNATLHFEYLAHFENLKNAYAPFDPDADTLHLTTPSKAEQQTQLDVLFEQFTWLLERANFCRLTKDDMQQALDSVSHRGLALEVDFGFFDRLEIYSRGEVMQTQQYRSWKRLYQIQEVQVPTFQRLALIFRLRPGRQKTRKFDMQDVFIKLFKDIPKPDLEMLLPGTRVKMSLKDRLKIVMPTVSGVAVSIYKAMKGALLAAAAGIYGILVVLGVTCGYGVKSFYGYLQTKQKYQLNLTESLYYQNLDNNAGVMSRLLDEAEEQENREAVLAYYFLWRKLDKRGSTDDELGWKSRAQQNTFPAGGFTAEELDQRIEQFLSECLGRAIDFEVDDALAKLLRMNLVRQLAGGRYVAVSLAEALKTLDTAWDNYFPYSNAA